MSEWWLRIRQLLSMRFGVVVIGLLLLAVLSGWLAYGAYVEPGTHVEERQVSAWSSTADFTHAATVREPNPVYSVGTTLENRTVYFESVAPVLNGTLEYEYSARDDGDLTVATDTWLTFQRVERDRDGDIETRYWETTRAVDQRRISDVGPGQTVEIPFSVNVSALANRSDRITEELGGTRGETEALVHVDVTLNGTVNGELVSRTDQHTLPISVGEVYRVSDPGTTTDEYTTTHVVTVENTYGPVRRIGAPLLLAVGLLALAGVAIGRSRGALKLSTDEREYLVYRADRNDFDEWINTISLPKSATRLPRAEADSLADLVDFAIDTNNSVIEDPETETYHVVHDGYRYVYEPPVGPDQSFDAPDEEPEDVDGPTTGDDPLAADPQGTDD